MGSFASTGNPAYITFPPFAGTISGYSINALGTSPTCTIDIWKIANGTANPTVSNTIMSVKPALTTGNVLYSSNVTGFTSTVVTANDIFAFNLDAVSAATRVVFKLFVSH